MGVTKIIKVAVITAIKEYVMKFIFAILALSISTIAIADTHVKGYTKSNGTYVEPHYRSSPNSNTYDNYGTKGNSNPYTGQQGTQNPEPSNQYQPLQIEPYKPYGTH